MKLPVTEKDPNNSVSFGNFGSQVCGALQLYLVNAQSVMAATGADLIQSLTEDQKESYQGQATFMKDAFDQAFNAASSQYRQMFFASISEFVSAGISIGGFAFSRYMTNHSDSAKQLDNVTNKLAQQEKLLSLTKEPVQPSSLTARTTENTLPKTAKEQLIESRRQQLLTEGAAQPRLLEEVSPGAGGVSKVDAEKEFPQEEFNPKQGNYYNGKATQEEVSAKHAVHGAHYIKGLDEEAVASMTPEERSQFISSVEKQIGTTRTEENNVRIQVQYWTGLVDSVFVPTGRSMGTGSLQLPQAQASADAKEQEATSTIANQGSNVAGNVVHGFRSSVESVTKGAESGMQAFGRVFDGMRA
ncbi:MAG: hypothetical protein RLZZ453_1197 [Chlamydiota bacterium]|jgi:hypothetical protein